MGKVLKQQDVKSKMDLEQKVNATASGRFVQSKTRQGAVLDKAVLQANGEAQHILQEAHAEAEKIRIEAKEILDQVKTKSEQKQKQGYEQGYQEGLSEVTQFIVEVKKLREDLFHDNEQEMVALVFDIAQKVIGEEFQQTETAIRGVVKQAVLQSLGTKIVVHVNPEDLTKLQELEKTLIERLSFDQKLVFKENESITRGGCLVESEVGTLDARLETQLAAIKQSLGI